MPEYTVKSCRENKNTSLGPCCTKLSSGPEKPVELGEILRDFHQHSHLTDRETEAYRDQFASPLTQVLVSLYRNAEC